MKLNDLHNTFNRQSRKRVGRGDGSGNGRSAGRGDKGAGQRSGSGKGPFFEGGQIPLIRRLPKRGFNHANHVEFEVVNLSTLESNFEAGAEINQKILQEKALLAKVDNPLKVLSMGELTKAFKVTADKFSAAAKAKIEAAGGTCTALMKPAAEVKAEAKAKHVAAKKAAAARKNAKKA